MTSTFDGRLSPKERTEIWSCMASRQSMRSIGLRLGRYTISVRQLATPSDKFFEVVATTG